MKIIEKIEKEQIKEDAPKFKVGDNVKVAVRVREGEKERIQNFSGVVIAREGSGINEAFTVRRISYGEGVERRFPVHSPFIESVTVERPGKVRRAKLYYLRDRKGQLQVKEDTKEIQASAAQRKADATGRKKKRQRAADKKAAKA
jgi:large subunit ribosomal protein L19